MGDWAEDMVLKKINEFNSVKSIHYGNSNNMKAGDEGFKEFFLNDKEEVRKYGKRPDLLLFSKNSHTPEELSSLNTLDSDKYVSKSIAAIEVRSSKFEAERYMQVKKERKETQYVHRLDMTLSFTVKVEDLKIVYRWIERQNIPQFYCQVFFDSIYLISVKEIFKIISEGKDFKLETPARSQLKTTLVIPVTKGVIIGKVLELPSFKAETSITELGRHDAYVVPVGGNFSLDEDKFISYLTE